MESEIFTYPFSKLGLRLAPIFGFLLIFILASLRASQPGHANPALFLIPLFAFVTVLPVVSLLAKYSNITVSDWGVKAQTLGLTWRKTAWADVEYVQRVRRFRDPVNKHALLEEVYFFGRGNKGTWRISFTPEIKGFDRLLKYIDQIASAGGLTLYAVDSAPKQFGQVRAGSRVESFYNLAGSI